MPKAEPHFDCLALLSAVHQQDVGLRITTNQPKNWRAIVYKHMRAAPHLRVHLYQSRRSPNSFFMLKNKLPNLEPLPLADEDSDAQTL